MKVPESESTRVLLGDHDGRLTKGADPDLVKYVYVSQIESQKQSFKSVIRYNMAHVVMMHEEGVFSAEESGKLLAGLKDIDRLGVENFVLNPEYQGVHPCIEADLVRRYGYEVGGKILTGRSRGDVHHTGERLAVRDKLLDVLEDLLELREVFLELAETHRDTVIPGYTWFQAAQPTTLAHDLLHLGEGFQSNFRRLKHSFEEVNLGICESGIGYGTDWPVNRERVAELLGFEGLVENTRFASRDLGNAEIFLLADLALLMGHIFRITNDFYPMTSQEFGYFEFGDEWSQTSFMMPQKKNPASLKSFRFKAIKTVGDLTSGLYAYFGSSPNMLGEMVYVAGLALDAMGQSVIPALKHMKGMMPTLTVNKELARERAGAYFTQATNLADVIAREKNLSFRTAHRIVGVLVRDAVKQNIKPAGITTEMVDRAAQEILGQTIRLDSKVLQDALDPVVIVKNRKGTGSTGSEMIHKAIENRRQGIAEDREWLRAKRALLEGTEKKLMRIVDSIAGSVSG